MRYRRSVLIAVLASVLLAPSLFAQMLTVQVRRGNVRSGPGDTYDVIGKVRRGQKFDVESRQGDWFKILLETGQEGWVFKEVGKIDWSKVVGDALRRTPYPKASQSYDSLSCRKLQREEAAIRRSLARVRQENPHNRPIEIAGQKFLRSHQKLLRYICERSKVTVGPGTPHQIGTGHLDTMVKVPAGWFVMGSERRIDDEKPRRRVYLDAFYIDKYPVTNSRFRRFGRPKRDYGSQVNGGRKPVLGVTWFQAGDYCKSVGKRLPTEAEWEKAARGVDGRQYPWGNGFSDGRQLPWGKDWEDGLKVIWSKNNPFKTHPVDRTYNTHRSPYGAVDMSGNGWEWVQDWYGEDYYQNAPSRNPKGPATGTRRVIRGGSWPDSYQGVFRAAFRAADLPVDMFSHLGFRCAKAP